MQRKILLLAFGSLTVAVIGFTMFVYYPDSTSFDKKVSSIIASVSSGFFSISIGVFLLNFYFDKKTRQLAAAPLIQLVGSNINEYHNELFILAGRSKFGTDKWNSLIDIYANNGRDPVCFSPSDRDQIYEMISENAAKIVVTIEAIDFRLSDVNSVLGWTFDAGIIASSLQAKYNISEFLLHHKDTSEKSKLKTIEMFFDIDANANGVLRRLISIVGSEIFERN